MLNITIVSYSFTSSLISEARSPQDENSAESDTSSKRSGPTGGDAQQHMTPEGPGWNDEQVSPC